MRCWRRSDCSTRNASPDHMATSGKAITPSSRKVCYFTAELTRARGEGRIGEVVAEPTLPCRAFWNIGGAGSKGDTTAIWITQNVSLEIRVLDYMEFVGQPLGFIVNELRSRGYEGIACTLPHDGVNANAITGKRYEEHLQDAGFTNTTVVKNQGAGAAAMRIEAVRRIFPQLCLTRRSARQD